MGERGEEMEFGRGVEREVERGVHNVRQGEKCRDGEEMKNRIKTYSASALEMFVNSCEGEVGKY